jgi:hypothetical protein
MFSVWWIASLIDGDFPIYALQQRSVSVCDYFHILRDCKCNSVNDGFSVHALLVPVLVERVR